MNLTKPKEATMRSAKVLGLTGTLLATAGFMAAAILSARAAELNITIGGPRYLREAVAPPPDARIIHVPRDESPEAIERRAEWLRICQPRLWAGPDGVSRYVYGAACPNGVIVNTWREVPRD